MIVTLDGHRLDSDFAPGCTLMDLIDRVRSQQPEERLIVSVSVNGNRYGENELGAGLARPLAGDEQVDLETEDRCTVAADALRAIAAEIAEAAKSHADIADRLSSGEAAEAIRQIGNFVNVWNSCTAVITQCGGLLGRDLTDAEHGGRNVRDSLAELAGRLRDLRDALEARDTVMLADLMHYEMPGLCETWQDVLTTLASVVEQPVASEA